MMYGRDGCFFKVKDKTMKEWTFIYIESQTIIITPFDKIINISVEASSINDINWHKQFFIIRFNFKYLKTFTILLTGKRNRRGDKWSPRWTSEITLILFDWTFLYLRIWILLLKNNLNYDNKRFRILNI